MAILWQYLCNTLNEAKSNLTQATVVRVIDGDTIVVNVNGKEERVRLIGIDTPVQEVKGMKRKKIKGKEKVIHVFLQNEDDKNIFKRCV